MLFSGTKIRLKTAQENQPNLIFNKSEMRLGKEGVGLGLRPF
jgi:hypothetical protein